MAIKTNLRYAHTEGFMSIFWSPSSKKFFTCGLDGEIRIWTDFENDDPISHTVSEQATAVCVHEEKLFVADEAGYIQTFLLPDYIKDGFVTKFNEHVTHMIVNKSGERLLACSRDFLIKWVAVVDNSQNTFGSADGHSAPVLSVALDPKEEYFASSSCDGSVKIWRLDDTSKPLKNLLILDKFNDISVLFRCSRPLCRLQWHPRNGEILAVPVKSGVHLYGRNTWNLIKTLQCDDISEPYSVCCFSLCGKYLAAGCLNGQIIVWDFAGEQIILNEQHVKKQSICELIWHPSHADRLIYCDTNGHVGVIKEVISCKSSIDTKTSNDVSSVVKPRHLDDDVDFEEEDDADIGAIKSKYNSQIFLDDGDDDDMQAVQNELARPGDLNEKTRSIPIPVIPSWKPKPAQETFIVGSTPASFSQRYMKWNSVGIVRQYNSEDECSVEVEFHDASTCHKLQIDNSLPNYSMTDLSVEAWALASNGSEENKFKGRLYVLHFGSWDSSRDWSSDLPDGEEICCLCLGSGWVAVASKSQTVWIFSVGGVQLRNFTVAGSIVTMAGCGNTLLISFQDGLDADGVTKMTCLLYRNPHMFDNCKCEYLPLTISKNSELTWFGFSAEETPCSCDSLGIVRLLINSTWVQIFDWKQEIGELACNAERDCRALEVARLADSTKTLNALINLATKKGRTVLAEKVADLARRRVFEQEQLQSTESEYSRTQQLFADEDEPEMFPVGSKNHKTNSNGNLDAAATVAPVENPLRRSESRSGSGLNLMPTLNNGSVRNPFKRNNTNDSNEPNDKTGNGRSVFDNFHMTSGKRHNDMLKLNELLENEPAKKKKTLIVKKQSKLSFGRQNGDSTKTHSNQDQLIGLELFKKENSQNLSQKFDLISADSVLSFNEFAEQAFNSLPEEDQQNWNRKALSLLEEIEKVESKRKVSLDNFAFST